MFIDRPKNAQALVHLGVMPHEIPGILRRLTVEDYAAGPLDERTPLYVKVSLSHGRLLCLSFHLAEPALPHPLRRKGVGKN